MGVNWTALGRPLDKPTHGAAAMQGGRLAVNLTSVCGAFGGSEGGAGTGAFTSAIAVVVSHYCEAGGRSS
jgi:hypothetical protein